MKLPLYYKRFAVQMMVIVLFCGGAALYVSASPTAVNVPIPGGGDSGDRFGHAIDAHGTYLIIGAPGDDDKAVDSGAIYIYKKSSCGRYSLEQKKTLNVYPPADGDEEFGSAVAMSDEFALAGSAGYSRVPIFNKKADSSWQVAALVQSSDYKALAFGGAMAVAGEYSVIGAHARYISGGVWGPGLVDIHKETGGSWSYVSSRGGDTIGDDFGLSIAMFGDYLIVGQPGRNVNVAGQTVFRAGQVQVYKRDGDTWERQAILLASPTSAYAHFGSSLSLSGEYLAVGSDVGSYVFKRTGTSWNQQARVNGSGDVAISEKYLLSVSQLTTDKYAYVYKRNGNQWNYLSKISAPYEGTEYPSVAIADNRCFLGLPSMNNQTGSVESYSFTELETGQPDQCGKSVLSATTLLLLK